MRNFNKIFSGYVLPILGIIMLILYVISFKEGLPLLFFSIFIIDRIISLLFGGKFKGCLENLDNLSDEYNGNGTISLNKISISLLGYTFLGVFILGCILFSYPNLFLIIMFGEVIDIVLKNIIISIKQ